MAVVLLCSLLFAEESGVPLPFAPGEIVLLAAGLLIASGGLNPAVFVPVAVVACIAGAVVGYSWTRLVGERGLVSLARRLHQERNLARVSRRVRAAGWLGVATSRLIPGLRIYTTLVAGAVRVPWPTFLVAMVPSTMVWVGAYIALGTVVGIPVEHFFNQLERLAVQGAILVAMGVGVFLAVRRTPPSTGAGLVRVPFAVRAGIAAAIDLGAIASIVSGLLALGGRLFGVGIGPGWIDIVAAMVVAAIIYTVVARRGVGATVGEALLQTSYISGRRLPRRPQEAWHSVRSFVNQSPDSLQPTADMLRALADPGRLRLVIQLLESPRTVAELAALSGTPAFEVHHQVDRLREAGVILAEGDIEDDASAVRIRPGVAAPLVDLLATAPLPVRSVASPEVTADA